MFLQKLDMMRKVMEGIQDNIQVLPKDWELGFLAMKDLLRKISMKENKRNHEMIIAEPQEKVTKKLVEATSPKVRVTKENHQLKHIDVEV